MTVSSSSRCLAAFSHAGSLWIIRWWWPQSGQRLGRGRDERFQHVKGIEVVCPQKVPAAAVGLEPQRQPEHRIGGAAVEDPQVDDLFVVESAGDEPRPGHRRGMVLAGDADAVVAVPVVAVLCIDIPRLVLGHAPRPARQHAGNTRMRSPVQTMPRGLVPPEFAHWRSMPQRFRAPIVSLRWPDERRLPSRHPAAGR